MTSAPQPLTALEIALGWPVEPFTWTAAQPEPTPRAPLPSARMALQRALVPALRRAPCVVSFSGGRDSSLLLALATRAAREAGLPQPIPATLYWPGVPEADEERWQRLVIDHLDLDEWTRLPIRDELEALGDVAKRVLDRHGLLWPMNTYFHEPIAELAAGGSLVIGWDGDGLLGGWRPPSLRTGRMRRAAAWLEPRPLRIRRTALQYRRTTDRHWPTATAAARAAVPLARGAVARDARTWSTFVRRYRQQPYVNRGADALQRLGGAWDVRVCFPLLDHTWLAALAQVAGIGSRTAWMRFLAEDLLPSSVLERATKGHPGPTMIEARSRTFIEGWTNAGLDESLIDVSALRKEWAEAQPDARSLLALHAAWLHDH